MITEKDMIDIIGIETYQAIKEEKAYKKMLGNLFIRELNKYLEKIGYPKETIESIYNSYVFPLEFQEDLEILATTYEFRGDEGIKQLAKNYFMNRY